MLNPPQTTRFLWQGYRLLQEQRAIGTRRTWSYDPESPWTPLEVTDAEGNLRWLGQYDTFGRLLGQTVAGSAQRTGPVYDQPLRYAGQYQDNESGLHYNLFRYYEPEVGRFTTQDPVGLAGGMNLYAYAPNPLGYIDPLGLTSCALSRSMKKAGTPRPVNSAAHHIVPETSKKANPARKILAKHDIDLNGADNGVFLPNKNNEGGLSGILHNGRHPNDYINTVNERILRADAVGGKSEVLYELGKMKETLSSASSNAEWKTVLGSL